MIKESQDMTLCFPKEKRIVNKYMDQSLILSQQSNKATDGHIQNMNK